MLTEGSCVYLCVYSLFRCHHCVTAEDLRAEHSSITYGSVVLLLNQQGVAPP